jgi:molybdopterin-containing oxidoreductase family iron-sulfur binding subunit
VVGFQQPVVNPLPGLDPRSFPDLLLTMSQELGLDDGLPNTFRDVLREEAQALHGLGRGSVQAATFEGFWNGLLQQGGWWDEDATSADSPPAPPNLAELVSQGEPMPVVRAVGGGRNVFRMVPFLSNSLLDGRSAHLPWLQAAPDPMTSVTWQTWVEINSRKAKEMGLEEGDVVRLVNNEGRSIQAVVYPHPAMPPNVVGVPVGQGHRSSGEYAMRDGERRGDNPIHILTPETERATGSLAWGATEVRVEATGRSTRVSKFEGIVPAFPIGVRDEDIVQVTRE